MEHLLLTRGVHGFGAVFKTLSFFGFGGLLFGFLKIEPGPGITQQYPHIIRSHRTTKTCFGCSPTRSRRARFVGKALEQSQSGWAKLVIDGEYRVTQISRECNLLEVPHSLFTGCLRPKIWANWPDDTRTRAPSSYGSRWTGVRPMVLWQAECQLKLHRLHKRSICADRTSCPRCRRRFCRTTAANLWSGFEPAATFFRQAI